MEQNHAYEVDLKWLHNRVGNRLAPGIPEQIEVVTPPEFPHGVSGIWSPEHLFTAAVSSCLMTTFLAIAGNSGLEFKKFDCKARGILEKTDGRFLMTEIILEPDLHILYEKDLERANRILDKAEAACLITHSIKSKTTLHKHIHYEH